MSNRRASRRSHRRFIVVVAAAAALGATSMMHAHDFFLVPMSFPFAAGGDVEVLAQSSSRFPTSVGPIAQARIAKAVMIGAEGESALTDFAVRGSSLVLRGRPAGTGQRIVAVDLVSRSARQTPSAFLDWLRLEGAAHAATHIAHGASLQGLDSLTRTDTKHAKTIIDVGSGGARSFSRSSGQMIEFIPLSDPAGLRVGDVLRARLTFKGQPLPSIAVHASVPAPADTALKGEPDVELVADASGVVSLPVRKTGLWLIRTIHVVESARGQWETHWASLVFKAGP